MRDPAQGRLCSSTDEPKCATGEPARQWASTSDDADEDPRRGIVDSIPEASDSGDPEFRRIDDTQGTLGVIRHEGKRITARTYRRGTASLKLKLKLKLRRIQVWGAPEGRFLAGMMLRNDVVVPVR